jgi:hypothetical protein
MIVDSFMLVLVSMLDHMMFTNLAGMTLCNLAANRHNRLAIVKHGGLRPLAKMATSNKLESQRAAALALYNLSCAAANLVRKRRRRRSKRR